MSRLFKPPPVQQLPTPEAPPPVPTVDAAAVQQDYQDRLRRRRGRKSTVLVPDAGNTLGVGAAASPASSVLGGGGV
jgi:hypothetical protein